MVCGCFFVIVACVLALSRSLPNAPLTPLARPHTTATSTTPKADAGAARGYKVAPAQGLTLVRVRYPTATDDPRARLYPELAHDAHGRLLSHHPPPRGQGGSGSDGD